MKFFESTSALVAYINEAGFHFEIKALLLQQVRFLENNGLTVSPNHLLELYTRNAENGKYDYFTGLTVTAVGIDEVFNFYAQGLDEYSEKIETYALRPISRTGYYMNVPFELQNGAE